MIEGSPPMQQSRAGLQPNDVAKMAQHRQILWLRDDATPCRDHGVLRTPTNERKAADSRLRNPASPSFAKMSGILQPAASTIIASVSKKRNPSIDGHQFAHRGLSTPHEADEDDIRGSWAVRTSIFSAAA
jgi:hypothetical protein